MGIFENEKFTCEDCIWGTQCPAEQICADFDPLYEVETSWEDISEFISVYDKYIKERPCPCKDEIYFPIFTGLSHKSAQGVM